MSDLERAGVVQGSMAIFDDGGSLGNTLRFQNDKS